MGHLWPAFLVAGIICATASALLMAGVLRVARLKDKGKGMTAAVFAIVGFMALSKSLRLAEKQ